MSHWFHLNAKILLSVQMLRNIVDVEHYCWENNENQVRINMYTLLKHTRAD